MRNNQNDLFHKKKKTIIIKILKFVNFLPITYNCMFTRREITHVQIYFEYTL